jgi:UDP-N-acetylglucosamine 2-epimerase (non-hydrolysing)
VELVGTDSERIVASVSRLLTDEDEYRRRQIDSNPYGDGQAASRIADLIAQRAWDSSSHHSKLSIETELP